MLPHLVELVLRGEGADLGAVGLLGAEGQPGGAGTEGVGEGVGDLLVHVEALDRDAELAGVGEGGDHGALDGAVEVDVLGDDHGVLAAQLGRHADEALAGWRATARPWRSTR